MKSGEVPAPPPVPPRAVRRSVKIEPGKRRKRPADRQPARPTDPTDAAGETEADEDGPAPNGRGKVVDIVV